MRTRYFHIKYFEEQKRKMLKRKEGFEFETESTTYTRKILTSDETMIFNESGDTDKNKLILITSVRNDAANYLKNNDFSKRETKINFFNLLGDKLINNDDVTVKIDLKSAYWERAKQKGVITIKTDDKYKKLFEGYDTKDAKQSRLMALGSTATSKHRKCYRNGKIFDEYVKRQETRPLYLSICGEIDDLMNQIHNEIEGCVYYYWDCMFVKQKFSQDVIQYIKEKGYNTTSQETKLEYVTIGGNGYLVSSCDDKVYMTRKENGNLIDIDEEKVMIEDYGN